MLATPELEIARNLPPANCAPAEAERYTRWLATHHYENFNVVSWLLPRRLHQHFYNLYAYCRWSDDFGDEIADPARALQLLDEWEHEVRQCYRSSEQVSHPVLIALRRTIVAKHIPVAPFVDLLRAFRQDQRIHRYQTWDDLFKYCQYSANPVGRLVLYLCGYRDQERQLLSDFTCTALQLANFWQDVSIDLRKQRIYIPLDELAKHGLTEADIIERRFDDRYVKLMKSLISKARELFAAGLPLAQRVDSSLRIDLELFSRGGLEILRAIEASCYNTLQRRPSLTRVTKVALLARALGSRVLTIGKSYPVEPTGYDAASSGVEAAIPEPERTRGTALYASAESVRASYAECNRIARAARSSFYLAFFGLRKEKRDALCALYAFMRLVDNVSDDPGNLDAKRQGLARWRAMLDEAVAGRTGAHAILPALADTIARFEIPTRYFHDLILGAEMDLTVTTYATFDRLSEYCYRVAGTVGLTCLHVFGFDDPKAPDLAERLGLAFQLTNISRDVGSDYTMGRIYLPQEDLDRFAVRAEELRGPITEKLQQLLEFEADRAWQMYREGAPLVAQVNPDSRATLWALVRTYSSLLARIEERDFDIFGPRVSLSNAEKIQYLLTAGLAARRAGRGKGDAIAKRSSDRRRPGGTVLRRRAG
ncbi:MAG: squalene synthase HpnC [Candidatus Acidiferrales bacterium]